MLDKTDDSKDSKKIMKPLLIIFSIVIVAVIVGIYLNPNLDQENILLQLEEITKDTEIEESEYSVVYDREISVLAFKEGSNIKDADLFLESVKEILAYQGIDAFIPEELESITIEDSEKNQRTIIEETEDGIKIAVFEMQENITSEMMQALQEFEEEHLKESMQIELESWDNLIEVLVFLFREEDITVDNVKHLGEGNWKFDVVFSTGFYESEIQHIILDGKTLTLQEYWNASDEMLSVLGRHIPIE